jgi:N-acetylmuramoyl-L-alanine amidase
LVELGYLSNADDEKEIADPTWRKGVLDVLAKSIEDYALTQKVAAQ